MYIAIAACDPQGIMGNEGTLPWHYPEDLAHFRTTTSGHTLLAGRITYQSLPPSLQQRCIVLSRTKPLPPPSSELAFVIGGGQIFQLFFEKGWIDEAIITHIHRSYEGDTLFPLHFLQNWPHTTIHTTHDFTTIHYVRPSHPHPHRPTRQ
jgi:dihydrofolate reductase